MGSRDLGHRPRERIGPYTLLQPIGEGGFGVVWLAERREPFVQRVALKIIKPGMDSRAVLARFDQERQALAVMDHPSVARVLDGGITSAEQGSRPYFVMEYVKGEPITTYCDRNRLTLRQRLELFIPVCEAVQHAHHKGIIHRDLKPSNVLVTVLEGRLAPKVIDFGVAKAVSRMLTEHTILTEHGQLIGTPEYMSPEQAEMGGTDVDTRTDVYSLAVLLYELLIGRLPFETSTLRAAALDEVRRIIREVEPPKPSTRMTTMDARAAAEIAGARQADREQLARTLRRELDWIPLKGMRKDRARRYATPGAMAEDIRAYLDNKPIQAAPESHAYLLKKFIARNRGPIAAAAIITLTLLAGIVASSLFAAQALRDRRQANESAAEAQRQANLAQDRLAELRQQKSAAESVAAMVDLLGRVQQELNGEEGGAYPAYYELLERLSNNELAASPRAEIAIRSAFATLTANSDSGDGNDALALIDGALALSRSTYGTEHAMTVRLLKDAAATAWRAEELGKAEDWYAQRVEVLRRVHAGDSVETAEALNDLGIVQEVREPRADALATFLEAEKMARRLTPLSTAVLDVALWHRDRLLRKLGHSAEAEPVRAELIRVLLDPAHTKPEQADSRLVSLARELADEGAFDAAARLWIQIGELRDRTEDPAGWRAAYARTSAGVNYTKLRRFSEAEPLLRQGFDGLRTWWLNVSRGGRDSEVHETLDQLQAMYTAWNQEQPSRQLSGRIAECETARQALAAEEARRAEAAGQRTKSSELNEKVWPIVRFALPAGPESDAKLAAALADARQAVELAPNDWNALNTLGVAEYRAGLFEQASQTLLRADSRDRPDAAPRAVENWVFIALSLHGRGLTERAHEARATFLNLARQSPERDSAEIRAWSAELDAALGEMPNRESGEPRR